MDRAVRLLRALAGSAGRERAGRGALALLPAALALYLAFASGGFFPLTIAVVVVGLGLVLVLRATVARDPLEGGSVALVVAVAALGLLGAWMLLSTAWGAAPLRAILEFDRLLLYLFGAALIGSVAWTRVERRTIVASTAGALLLVCLAGLASRLVPALWPVDPGFAAEPVNYPLGYVNALGILAGIGLVLAFGLTTDDRGPRVLRVLAAAAAPAFAATVLLTFSRGAVLATATALVAYVVLARPRGLVAGALATAPTVAYALSAVWAADLVAPALPTAPPALAQAGGLARAIALACLGAAALRALGLPLDAALGRVRVGRPVRRAALGAGAAAVVVAALVLVLAVDVPAVAAQQYDRLVNGVVPADGAIRDRLTAPGASGRFQEWSVATRQFRATPVSGSGAGSYQAVWAEHRPVDRELRDAHSLYFEVAGELGAVGLALIAIAVLAILAGLVIRCRGEQRALLAAVAAAWLAWALHAGIDWDWEMPALTLPAFCLAAAGLSYRPGATEDGGAGRAARPPARLARVIAGVALLALIVTPTLLAVSQVRLERSVRAWKQSDCSATIDSALGSLDALPVRTEPFELIAYCDARFAQDELSERAMRSALDRDPRSWELWYGLALVRGSARRDPRPAMREARRLNPLEPLAIEGSRLFRTANPAEWQRRALAARLPIP